MRIDDHPFKILGITPRSNKQEILGHANNQADPDTISASRFQLTHPTRRLDAEVSWFPGVAPSRTAKLIEAILSSPDLPLRPEATLLGLECLCRFNVLAYWLTAHERSTPDVWDAALKHLVDESKGLNSDEVTQNIAPAINADRAAAGLPQIADISAVEGAVTRLTERTAADLAEHLMHCRQHAQVVTTLVEHDIGRGETEASEFVGRFVDRYQILVKPMLDRYGDRAVAPCERMLSIARASVAQRQSPSTVRLSAAARELEERLSQWAATARPIQWLMKSRGRKDPASIELGQRIRSIAVTLANECQLYEEAESIITVLNATLGQVPELTDLMERDLETLGSLIEARRVGPGEGSHQQTEFRFTTTDQTPTSESSPGSTSPSEQTESPFVQLCLCISKNCWDRIKPNSQEHNLSVIKSAYDDYRTQALPWLRIISSTQMDNTRVIRASRNAAAKCLSSLAGALLCADNFDQAEVLTHEASTLVLEDTSLDEEIRVRLDYIATKKREAASFTQAQEAARAARERSRTTPKSASASTGRTTGTRPVSRPFTQEKPRTGLPLLVQVVIWSAVVVSIPFAIELFKTSSPNVPVAGVPATQGVPVPAPPSPGGRETVSPPAAYRNHVPEATTDSAAEVNDRPAVAYRQPQAEEVFSQPALLLPPTGPMRTLWEKGDGMRFAPFDVIAPSDGINHCVRAYDAQSRKLLLELFVRSGETASLDVPIGRYELHVASGRTWYGEDSLFGPQTAVSKGEDLVFSIEGRKELGHTIELRTQVGGNYKTTPIDRAKF
jgi:hypothetical protein